MKLEELLNQLWAKYSDENPSAKKIKAIFENEGEVVDNDHIAFRTFNDPRINIEVLAKPIQELGYVEKGEYKFEQKHLFAKHYEHPELENAPRIFISELILENFSPFLQDTINERINQIDPSSFSENLLIAGTLWPKPDYNTYVKLREESEYAAWLYVYGFRVNHFTVLINSLQKFTSIENVNDFLKTNGFKLNTSGGEIKGSASQLLEQSSIMADIQPVEFTDRVEKIPSCYYEFAKRYADKNGNLFSGFISDSADKIFESTNFYNK